jgi:hypothetical protein
MERVVSERTGDNLSLVRAGAGDRDVSLNHECAGLAGGAHSTGKGQRVGARAEYDRIRTRRLIGLEDRPAQRPGARSIGKLGRDERGRRQSIFERRNTRSQGDTSPLESSLRKTPQIHGYDPFLARHASGLSWSIPAALATQWSARTWRPAPAAVIRQCERAGKRATPTIST